MNNFHEQLHVLYECPKCGRHALTKISSERYECLWCNFHRNLSHRYGVTRPGRFDGGAFFFVLIAVIVGLIVVGG